ncbi:DNA-directed RNA polymerase I core subunit rpa12 [Chytridiales sp. JEL 0842]|nr:DNA-directed RNA polymerase I core subunit rpa12 [Chytridiales sp. JEL 0842]
MSSASGLIFCPDCASLIDTPGADDSQVSCRICGTSVDASAFDNIQVLTESKSGAFPSRPKPAKESTKSGSSKTSAHLRDGATIKEKCPKCEAPEMVFHTAQLRSADEGQTVFYSCVKCG